MDKIPLILLIILTCISCEDKNQSEVAFENLLPNADRITLSKIVSSYDNLIKNEFDGDPLKFLSQVKMNKRFLRESQKQEYCELARIFDESTLEFKKLNVNYDSVYISESGNIVKIKKPEDVSEEALQVDDEISVLPPGRTIDAEIEEIKNRGYWRFISASSFTSALSKTMNENNELMEYVNTKDDAGYLNPQKIASSILDSKTDVQNYFIKRIIVLEVYIKQIKSEYGC